MAEQDKSQQTEEATPRKKEKLAKEGKLPKSADVGAAAVLFGATLSMVVFGGDASREIARFARRSFALHETPIGAVQMMGWALVGALTPILIFAMIFASAAGLAQTKGRVNFELLALKWDRLDPSSRLKQLLPSKESALEIGKQLLKVCAIGLVVWWVLEDAMPAIITLPSSHPLVGISTVADAATQVALRGGIAFVLVAALDYVLARRKFNEENKMSKRDLKDEHKESEGDPLIKQRRRRRARELAERRALSDVSKATVLVCNPTHIAVALRYVPGEDPAPITLGMAIDDVALAMRAKARSHGIPIVENRPFARALHARAEPGKPIPADLYGAAAEVIAHVLRLGGQR